MFYLITDIGSTTTKSYLCDENGKALSIAKVPTTVEKPFEDVSIGFFNAVKALEENRGITLFENGGFSKDLEVYFTSSAGGGLQVTVVALTELYSAKIGEKAALGSGAIINSVICGGDNRTEEEKIEALRESHPDLILFADGADSEFISTVCRMSKFVEKGNIKNKFKKSNTPIIYSGNYYVIPEIRKILKNYPLFVEENICNNFKYSGENLQKQVLEIFQNHVMHDAPGYPKIQNLTSNEILPTPIAVSRAMKLLGKDKNILLFDIGGATTDVYTIYHGKFFRSVSANIGMSYSIVNTLKECGVESIKKYLPKDFTDDEILNYIGNKYINPTDLPKDKKEEQIEASIAINAINKAIENHFKLYQREFKEILSQRSWLDKLLHINNEIVFDIVIGSGGIISNNSAKYRKFIFSNINIKHYEALFDKNFLFPHVGITSVNRVDFSKKLLKESLHNIDFDKEVSQKIYKTNISKEKSIYEDKTEITIGITLEISKSIKKKQIKADEIIFEKKEKVYKKFYISLPIFENLKIEYKTSKKVLKEGDLIFVLKKDYDRMEFFAQFDCELIEINRYQIVLSELKDIDLIKDYVLYKKDKNLKGIVRNLINKNYPSGLIGKSFYCNQAIISRFQDTIYVPSPITGVITDYNPKDLTVSMKRLEKHTQIKSFASGVINKIDENHIKIKSEGTKIKCRFGLGKSRYAKIGENAIFLKSESDFINFMQNDKLNVAISYNLPYKNYLQLSKKEDKSLIIINGFDDFTNSEIFDDVISKLDDKKFYCYTKTRMKSGVERSFMYFE